VARLSRRLWQADLRVASACRMRLRLRRWSVGSQVDAGRAVCCVCAASTRFDGLGSSPDADWLILRSSQIRLAIEVFGSMIAFQTNEWTDAFPGKRKKTRSRSAVSRSRIDAWDRMQTSLLVLPVVVAAPLCDYTSPPGS